MCSYLCLSGKDDDCICARVSVRLRIHAHEPDIVQYVSHHCLLATPLQQQNHAGDVACTSCSRQHEALERERWRLRKVN